MLDDDWGAEQEAIEDERRDADMVMLEDQRLGAQIARRRRAGVCCHQSAVGYLAEPLYPEQHGLTPGQLRCTDGCGEVFESSDDWDEARAAAIHEW